MNELFKQRQRDNFSQMSRYLKLVLNDQFTIAIMFLMGGLGYWYAGFLKSLTFAWWEKIIAMVLMIGLLQMGRLATLFKPADKIFLMPQEVNMETYLKQGFWHSMWIAQAIQLIGVTILLPFIQVAFQASIVQSLWLYPTFVVFKSLILYDQMQSYYSKHSLIWLRIVLPLITFALFGVRLDMAWAFVFVVLAAIGRMSVRDKFWQGIFNWQSAIDDETSRQLTIYRFFNLFTDVPKIKGKTRLRAWLNWFFNHIPKNHNNLYTNLYWRGLLRNDEYFGLLIRLTIIGAIVAYFVHNTVITPLILALIVYLIAFQLLPLYERYDDIAFTHLYPVNNKMKRKNFVTVLVRILMILGFIMVIVNAIGEFDLQVVLVTLGLLLVEIYVFCYLIVPKRIKKSKE